MKNVYEVLRQKELELTRLEKEVEALRIAAPLLSEEKESLGDSSALGKNRNRNPHPAAAVTGTATGGSYRGAGRRPAYRLGRNGQALALIGCAGGAPPPPRLPLRLSPLHAANLSKAHT